MMLTSDTPIYQTLKRGLRYLFSSYLLPTLIAAVYLLYAMVCLAGEPLPTSNLASTAAIVEPVGTMPTANYHLISEWHLFGQAEAAVMTSNGVIEETQLQLKLLGTFVSSAFTSAMSAVIQSDDGSQNKYKIGDTLPGGAVLEDIFATRVLLTHNGRRESLALQRQGASLASNAE